MRPVAVACTSRLASAAQSRSTTRSRAAANASLEWTIDAGDNGPPPHLHREHQEAFFVVEGTLTFRAGEETIKAEAGSFLFIPSGVVHTFSNRSDAPARCVNAYVPGGIEGFFVEVGEALASGEPDPAQIERLSAKYDVFFPES